jgi:hypothetical protein
MSPNALHVTVTVTVTVTVLALGLMGSATQVESIILVSCHPTYCM